MILLTRRQNEKVVIGSLETTGYEITVSYLKTEGKDAKLGFEYRGQRVEILRSELLEKKVEP